MSAKPDLWMPLYFGAYLTDTMHLTTEQHGAYFLLLMACWKRGGELPDDDAQLAAITRLTLGQWRKARSVIAPFWQISSGIWKQKRLTIELQAARQRSATAKENGSLGGRPRKADGNLWVSENETKPEPRSNPGESSVPLPRPLQTSGPRPSPSPSPESGRTSRKRSPKTDLPPDFALSDRVTTWASGKGFDRLPEHLESFVSKVRQHGYRYVDWDEALMTAIREDWARLRNGKARPGDQGAAIAEAERRIFSAGPEKDVGE